MHVRLERFDEVAIELDVFYVDVDNHGNLRLADMQNRVIALINHSSWAALYDREREGEARVTLAPFAEEGANAKPPK